MQPSKRLIICTKDIELITGVTSSQARRILRDLKDSLGKLRNQKVTIPEYCNYFGLDAEQIKKFLNVEF